MATINNINLGTAPDNGTGDNLRAGGEKINSNFQNLNNDKEEKIGNPSEDGMYLISTASGIRSWNKENLLFVETVPTTGTADILYAESSTHSLKIWNGSDYEMYGGSGYGGSVTYQSVIDALGFTPLQSSTVVSAIDTELGSTEWQTQKTQEQIEDIVGALLQAGTHTNITVNYDDVNNKIDLSASGTGNSLTEEEVEDIVGGLATQGTGINISYDDANNVLVISLTGESFTTAYKNKLDGIEANANNYQHPATHSPSIINQDANNRFVTDTEKATWNSKEDKRTRKVVNNTSQYTVVDSDFTDSELHFTGVPSGSTIDVVVNTGVCPNTNPSTGLQIVVHSASKISFSGSASLTPQPGATLTSANDGSSVAIIGIKPTDSVNAFGVFGSLESDGTGTGIGDLNVQADWNETDNTSDAFIKNKPNSLGGVQSDLDQTDNTADDFIKNKSSIPDYVPLFDNNTPGKVPAPGVSGSTTYTAIITSPSEGTEYTEGDVVNVTATLNESVVGAGRKKLVNESPFWVDDVVEEDVVFWSPTLRSGSSVTATDISVSGITFPSNNIYKGRKVRFQIWVDTSALLSADFTKKIIISLPFSNFNTGFTSNYVLRQQNTSAPWVKGTGNVLETVNPAVFINFENNPTVTLYNNELQPLTVEELSKYSDSDDDFIISVTAELW